MDSIKSPTDIGERIRAAREAADLTQTQLAAAAGLSHASAVSNFERGLRPSDAVIARIAAALDIDPERLR
jgi:transcriptional regulator with XRE-family HTH domain